MVTKLKKAIGFFLLAAVAGFAGAGVYNKVNENRLQSNPAHNRNSTTSRRLVKFPQ